jgi:hypothetical protein
MPLKRTLRADVQRLTSLADSRLERTQEAVAYASLLLDQKLRLHAQHDALLQVIATHLTPALRAAVEGAGFRAELEYALLDPRHTGARTPAGPPTTEVAG